MPLDEAERRLLEEFLGTASPRFPQGKVSADDQGELGLAVTADNARDLVILRFAKPVDWLGMDAETARRLGLTLIEKSNSLAVPES